MASRLELKIRKKLMDGKNPDAIGEEILSNLSSSGETSLDFKKDALCFLMNSGQNRKSFLLIRKWLNDGESIPWGIFSQLIYQSQIIPSEDFLSAFIEGCSEQNLQQEMLPFHHWDNYSQKFPEMRQASQVHVASAYELRVLSLKEKLSYLESQRMIEEEERLLGRLERMFPADPDIQKQRENFKERWAREVLAKSRAERTKNKIEAAVFETLSGEELEVLDIILPASLEIVEKSPELATHLAVALFQMDAFSQCLEVIDKVEPTESTDWLKLEALIASRKFIECLDQLQVIEVRYADNPETLFASTYLRAMALLGLGQTSSALELLKGIVHIRPGYRSAAALITERGNQ